ncbi:hypothetical protein METH_02690 [Leisingera methylohalidivorans DSM 14336]|uniref:Serine hydroxymethyltransferase n=1 Tax=Leisingera methylohalidivorans DSM 14336 TaxID=999552 RepID=V9VY33_9RHOB|nr:hypothetical protein METH_02690 [Leisingera methylohalidivorans DSM 14336]
MTQSHQFALEAVGYGGGQAASKQLRKAGFLACGIGLPVAEGPGVMNGLRIGTPELVRGGVKPRHAPQLAELTARGLRAEDPAALAAETAEVRAVFPGMHYIRQG